MKPSTLLRSVLAISLLLVGAGAALAQDDCEEGILTTTLIAGQNTAAGSVTVFTDGNQICANYTTVDGWVLTETHFAIATTLDGIPQTKKGNPRPGLFPYTSYHDPGLTDFTFCFEWPIVAEETVFVAAHAVVERPDGEGGVQQETGWGDGEPFPGANWATYFTFVPLVCDIHE